MIAGARSRQSRSRFPGRAITTGDHLLWGEGGLGGGSRFPGTTTEITPAMTGPNGGPRSIDQRMDRGRAVSFRSCGQAAR
jgi:hypothetical protein